MQHHAEHERLQLFWQRGFDHRPVGIAADSIENEAGNPHGGIEVAHSEHDRAGGTGHSPYVEDEHDRNAEQLGDLGGTAFRPAASER